MAKKREFSAVNADEVSAVMESEDFIHKGQCGCGHPLYTFHIVGESVEGRLRPCKKWDRADRARTAELHGIHEQTGRPTIIAIRLSKWLWGAITKGDEELWGQWVRITYQGSIRGRFPNAMKVYLVEVDKGAITPKVERIEYAGSGKGTKARARKAIRRPSVKQTAAAARG